MAWPRISFLPLSANSPAWARATHLARSPAGCAVIVARPNLTQKLRARGESFVALTLLATGGRRVAEDGAGENRSSAYRGRREGNPFLALGSLEGGTALAGGHWRCKKHNLRRR
eukprot:GHVT01044972.1.p2 GENE.GHVT01044972.1~~GHVT01044972.1.p2  ORF type:complete len:114 (-),score=18.64 GHVT01044972.1:109-450(-)